MHKILRRNQLEKRNVEFSSNTFSRTKLVNVPQTKKNIKEHIVVKKFTWSESPNLSSNDSIHKRHPLAEDGTISTISVLKFCLFKERRLSNTELACGGNPLYSIVNCR